MNWLLSEIDNLGCEYAKGYLMKRFTSLLGNSAVKVLPSTEKAQERAFLLPKSRLRKITKKKSFRPRPRTKG